MSLVGKWSLSALFHYKAKIKREPVKAHKVSNPFHAVSIQPALMGSCSAAHRCGGQRFLSAEAPVLPLQQCDAKKCLCRYMHHEDRRAEPRRIADERGPARVWAGAERRQNGGRRITDL